MAKYIFSGLALYWVFSKIDGVQTLAIIKKSEGLFLLMALCLFIASKVLSAFRLHCYFRCIGLSISRNYNLRLYWIGMFYNLFLPGGIGGDGYKVFLLHRVYQVPVQDLIKVSILDRTSGLFVLVMLAGSGYLMVDQSNFPAWVVSADMALLLVMPAVFWLVLRHIFTQFSKVFWQSVIYSVGVQLLQILSAYCILKSLSVDDLLMEYIVLFLASSVVAVMPFTIGGIGARELTFVFGYLWFGINQNAAVAFSLLFFLISTIASIPGGFLKRHNN